MEPIATVVREGVAQAFAHSAELLVLGGAFLAGAVAAQRRATLATIVVLAAMAAIGLSHAGALRHDIVTAMPDWVCVAIAAVAVLAVLEFVIVAIGGASAWPNAVGTIAALALTAAILGPFRSLLRGITSRVGRLVRFLGKG